MTTEPGRSFNDLTREEQDILCFPEHYIFKTGRKEDLEIYVDSVRNVLAGVSKIGIRYAAIFLDEALKKLVKLDRVNREYVDFIRIALHQVLSKEQLG